MTELATHASRSAAALPTYRTGFGVALGMALLMTVTGAFETGEIRLVIRLAYWLVVMVTGAMIGMSITTAVRNWGKLSAYAAAEILMISLLVAFPISLVVTGAGMIFFGMRAPSFFGLTWLFMIVAFVSLVITTVTYAIERGKGSALADPKPTATTQSDNPLRERLPLHLREAAIYALEAEDHYLRVHTDQGDALILARLGDAVRDMASSEGMQTHRSWWVAQAAVGRADRVAGKVVLTLSNGINVPVSRSYVKALAKAGWLG